MNRNEHKTMRDGIETMDRKLRVGIIIYDAMGEAAKYMTNDKISLRDVMDKAVAKIEAIYGKD